MDTRKIHLKLKISSTDIILNFLLEPISKPSQHYFRAYNPLQDLVKEITSYFRF